MWVEKTSVAGDYEEAAGTRSAVAAPFAAVAAVDRRCDRAQYTKRSIPSVSVRGDIIAYASPDSTFAVTKKLFDAAKKSILIGIYDFTAPHMRQLVLDAMARGVKVSLMLDIDGRDESDVRAVRGSSGMVGRNGSHTNGVQRCASIPACGASRRPHISTRPSSRTLAWIAALGNANTGPHTPNSAGLLRVTENGASCAVVSSAVVAEPPWPSACTNVVSRSL